MQCRPRRDAGSAAATPADPRASHSAKCNAPLTPHPQSTPPRPCSQILGGQLSDRYGGSAVLAGGVALWSACAALAPLAAAHGPYALLAARAGLGLAQGVAFPAIHALLARGVPAGRRSASIGAIMAMAHCGTALAFGLSPALIEVRRGQGLGGF